MSTVMEVLRKAGEGPRPGGGAGLGSGLPPEPPRRRGPRPIVVVLGAIALVLAFLVGLEFSGSDPVQVAEEQAAPGVAVPDAPASGGRSGVAARDSGEEAPTVPGRLAAAQMPAAAVETRPEAKPVVAVQENAGSQTAMPKSNPSANPTEAKPDPTASPAEVGSDSAATQAQARAGSRPPAPAPGVGLPGDEGEAPGVSALQQRRQARRQSREDSRRMAQEMRKAVQNAGSDEDRQMLIAKFRDQRATARAEKRAEDAERRLRLEARAQSSAVVAGTVEQNLAGTPANVPVAGPLTTGGRLETAGVSSGSGRAAVDAPDPDRPAVDAPDPDRPAVDAPDPARKVLRRAPSGAPSVRINILQYSRDPDRRFAYMSLEGQPAMTHVREGESYQGLTVKRIFPDIVEFDHSGSLFLLRAN